MKKKDTTTKTALTIDEIAELYRKYSAEAKAAEKNGEKYKKQLIDYARQNGDRFDDNTLTFQNGVSIDKRNTVKCCFDKDAITPDWIMKMCDADYGDFIHVAIDKEITEDDHHLTPSLAALLAEIEFNTENKQTFVIRA